MTIQSPQVRKNCRLQVRKAGPSGEGMFSGGTTPGASITQPASHHGRPRMDSTRPRDEQAGHCPHIDRGDSRCACMFQLGRIASMFEVCCDKFLRCGTYHQITLELDAVKTPMIQVGAVGEIQTRQEGDPILVGRTTTPLDQDFTAIKHHAEPIKFRPTGT